MDTPAIRITNLRKRYPGFELEDVSFTLPRGYVMGLVGPNGAGKTTIVMTADLYTAKELEGHVEHVLLKTHGITRLRDIATRAHPDH